MTTRHLSIAAAGLLTCGIVAFAPVRALAQDGGPLPEKGQSVTVVGCFDRAMIGDEPEFVIARPIMGSVASVADGSCKANSGDQLVKLQDLRQAKVDRLKIGRWVEIDGRLEGNHRSDGIREVHVKAMRDVPIVPPKVAEAAPEPAPVFQGPDTRELDFGLPKPVATSGVTRTELPKTATLVPLIGIIGFVSLFGALAIHLLVRQSVDRG